MSLSFHRFANIFPLIQGSDFDGLVSDIKSHGLREKIVLFEGAILDGRNRYRACQAAGIEPATELFSGDNPLAFVISKNLKRRQLKDSQRALVAARIANMSHGGDRKSGGDTKLITQSVAAELLNVQPRTLRWGRQVEKHCADSVKALVEGGKLSVSAAGKISHLPQSKQNQFAEAGARAIVAAARKSDGKKGRHARSEYAILWRHVDAICEALESSRLDQAHISASALIKEIGRVVGSRRTKGAPAARVAAPA